MPIRLKRLEMQGFKSFATRTVFDLSPGITAVIGPNGSGKSNLSEAVRWVLGEQSNLALRGRKGEDVIFAGGSGRAALGMAEVALTLDNSDGELPLEFSEVTIARRIFRDGDTHYLINGGRVRLRDLLQVTAALGQSYTVIGQGLVDAALSARPDERRGLFERHFTPQVKKLIAAFDFLEDLRLCNAGHAREDIHTLGLQACFERFYTHRNRVA